MKYQSVIVSFSNGKTGIFTGPAVIEEGEEKSVRITGIQFTPPKELPPSFSFSTIDDTIPLKKKGKT